MQTREVFLLKSVLFVCTGNTCRSPMAEGLLRDMLEKKGSLEGDFKVKSAGVFASEGDSVSTEALEAMREKGIDISNHRAQRLTPSMLREADIVLAMTKNHRDAILSIDPLASDKTYTLAEYGARYDKSIKNVEIIDPYGQPIEAYRQSAKDIEAILRSIVDGL